MFLKTYYLGCLAHGSYLVGDERSGQAAVIDPQRDVDGYLTDAAARGLAVKYVVLTHFHADFVAGHLELRDRVGARVCLGARARAGYEFLPLADGDELDLGRVKLRALETPGHTPEAISLLLFDLDRELDGAGGGERPHAVFTGDTLFIGDVGRPDLLASSGAGGEPMRAETLAGQLYDSLQGKLLPLPDETLVYPAHGAGSMCGKSLSDERVSTMGVQRRHNYALQPMPREAFVALVTADQPEAPDYFAFDAELNRRDRPTLDAALHKAMQPLALEALLARAGEVQLVDVREPADYEAAHLVGSINIGLGGKFATWAGTLLSRDRPIVLVADPGREAEAATRLGRIGFDHVAGFLDGGMGSVGARVDLLRRTERMTAQTLRDKLGTGVALAVVDVRGSGELAQGTIDGSVHVPLAKLGARLGELPPGPLVVHCTTGYRSAIACSLLERAGRDAIDLVGGFAAWKIV
jgi:glyoxylase-like metal-dependent hydrolase (beta-lactamase superfamily II)/rhodanese-related sulfurtransferase